MPMPMPITHPRRLATTVAALTVLVAALLPFTHRPAVADTDRHQHPLHSHASFEYDGTGTVSMASSRPTWGDHPLRVQAHGSATDGLVLVRALIHPAPAEAPVIVEDLVIEVTVTAPDESEQVATMRVASAVIDAAGLTLTATVPAGGPGGYTLTGTAAYTVVPAPEPEPTTTPPAPTAPTPPTPTSPPVAKQAAAASPVAAPPTFAG